MTARWLYSSLTPTRVWNKAKVMVKFDNTLGNSRKKSNSKSRPKSDKPINKDEEEMNKILNALKFFKDQTNNSKNSSGLVGGLNEKDDQDKNKEKENVCDKEMNNSSSREPESRPRTSRCKKSSKTRKKSGNSGGGNSALGFHSKLPLHPLLQQIDHFKNPHNRSVNIVGDSPRSKKRKVQKGRVSPNTFAIHHQRHGSGVMHAVHHSKNASLEQEKLALLSKGRPRSAKLKRKVAKPGEKSKKSSINRQANNSYVKNGVTTHSLLDSSLIMEEGSYDKEDKNFLRFMKKHTANIKKVNTKLKAPEHTKSSKISSNKFMLYKRPESGNKSLMHAYEQMSYIEDFQKMHNNIEEFMRNKGNLKFDAKRKKAATGQKKKKPKRSATPGLSVYQ